MFLESFINQKIQIKLKNFPEHLTGQMTGIYDPDAWYLVKLMKTESLGIWVENPCHKRVKIQEEDGTVIPEDKQKEEECTTNVLIRWEYISSVITFPAETTIGVDKKAKLIGFRP
ncbi:hypothetical protein AB1K84_23520 [Mesobacillus foraminis]|uniref:Uncharacterized protein n=2 Tax=Mesobacillus foraminis TaxID=279826 RepID=A0A4V2RDH2_9BACI|nr:hypothetical protein [Mesobacillus foraminis]MBT2757169.1 hypothetical protein [Mesobacillus foraminis]TCN24830.1 hypothetical protein EV146_10629 [Mesobacillus foraminis]